MSNQRRIQEEVQRHRHRDGQSPPVVRQDGTGASSTYREEAEAMRQRLDAALASGITNLPAAGPSVVPGQRLAHQVVRPGTQIVRSVSNETLVQSFRHTPGE